MQLTDSLGHRRSSTAASLPPKRGDAVGLTRKGKGTKWMLVADGNGTPIACHLASANICELDLAKATLAKVAIRTKSGRIRNRPDKVVADKGYDARRFRRYLRSRGIKVCVPARERTDRFGKRGRPYATDFAAYAKRWKIERTFAWLGQFRRLIVRHESILDVYQGFFHIACLIISMRVLLK